MEKVRKWWWKGVNDLHILFLILRMIVREIISNISDVSNIGNSNNGQDGKKERKIDYIK